MASTSANRKTILDEISPNTKDRPSKMPHSFCATHDQLLETAENVHVTIPLLLVESFRVVWASSYATHGYILAPRILGQEDPWDFSYPVHLLIKKDTPFIHWTYHGKIVLSQERLPDLDPEEALELSEKVQEALGINATSHGVRCVGFQYQGFDAQLSEALNQSFNKPEHTQSTGPSPESEREHELDHRHTIQNGEGDVHGSQGYGKRAEHAFDKSETNSISKKRRLNESVSQTVILDGTSDLPNGSAPEITAPRWTTLPPSSNFSFQNGAQTNFTNTQNTVSSPTESSIPEIKLENEPITMDERFDHELYGATVSASRATERHPTHSFRDPRSLGTVMNAQAYTSRPGTIVAPNSKRRAPVESQAQPREWRAPAIASNYATSPMAVDRRNKNAESGLSFLHPHPLSGPSSTGSDIAASGSSLAEGNNSKIRHQILSKVPFPRKYVDQQERMFTSHSSGRVLEILARDANQPFYLIPEAESSSPWLNWTCDHRTTGWCLSPPRITQKADIERQRSTDGLNTPEVWERDRDVEIVESFGDGAYLYVGTFRVIQEPLPKMDLLEFESLSSETQLAVRERIMLGHEQQQHVHQRIWSNLRAGKTLLPCIGFKYVGYNIALLKRLQGLVMEQLEARFGIGESSRPHQRGIEGSATPIPNGNSAQAVDMEHELNPRALSSESRRLLRDFDGILSALQRYRTDVETLNPASLIHDLQGCTRAVVDNMMEERVRLLSQIQEMKGRLENLEAGASS
ncbi:hypothetical protein FRB95_002804 [Tulasnella sp. JGI-2019a]|nr:hypothetical protein FRB95_002804 [Tulasnella sp. JGI-2019a]